MASYLGAYKNCAADRVKKFHRAVVSVLMQSFENWELIIISDGCQQTIDETASYKDPRIKLSPIAKQKIWSGGPRNRGIANAKGEYILYLDTDDMFGQDHLLIIDAGIYYASLGLFISLNRFLPHKTPKNPDWVYFNDYIYSTQFLERQCIVEKQGHHGTGNVCHRRDIDVYWNDHTYLHDFYFVKALRSISNGVQIPTPQYYVCHIPELYDI